MEELIKSLKNTSKASNLRSAWSESSEYPIADVDWSPTQKYVSMLERKVVELGTENESLQKVNGRLMHMIKKVEEQLEGTDAMTKLRIAWALASNYPYSPYHDFEEEELEG